MDSVAHLGNVWVTGGAGFIGSNLIDRLYNLDLVDSVVSLDNESSGNVDNVKEHLDKDNFHQVKRSVSGFDVWSNLYSNIRAGKLIRPDIIFHLAAQPRIQPSFIDPTETIRHNVQGTAHMLELARSLDTPCRVVYAGSSTADWDHFANPYAWSKHAGEELCYMYHNIFSVPTHICRFYNVYGPRQIDQGDYATVIGIFLRQFRAGEPLTVTGDGTKYRDFTHVTDICNGLIASASELQKNEFHERWSLGTGMPYTIGEIANLLAEHGATIKYIDERPGEAHGTQAETETTNKLLEWKAELNLFDYLKDEIDGNKD